jgi:hypothetical protein
MRALAGVCVLVALAPGLSAWLGSQKARAAVLPPTTERSGRLLLGGRVRCTATVVSEVRVGESAKVTFALHNISKHSVKVVLGTELILRASDGTTYDTSAFFTGLPMPPPIPKKLRGGATLHLGAEKVPVRWTGPLQITPECLGKALPVLRVGVVAPWPRPHESAAVGEVVAAAGHLLDQCRPQEPGVAVDGQIAPPSGSAPPMDARCSVSLSSEGAFLVAQVLVLTPPSLAGVQIFQPYETLWAVGQIPLLTISPPSEAIAWEFVVTRDRAIPVAASSVAATNSSGQTAPSFNWNGTGWQQEGEGSCGGTAFASGGSGPDIEFISACTG